MNPLLKALTYGYTASQVLDFLGQKSPQVGEMVKQARGSGHKPAGILKYFAQSLDSDDYDPEETAYEGNKKLGSQRNRKLIAGLSAIGGLAAYALKRSAPAIAGALTRQSTPQQTQQNLPTSQSSSQPPIQAQIPGSDIITQQPDLVQPQTQEVPIQQLAQDVAEKPNVREIFRQLDVDKQIENFSEAHPPETVAKLLEHNFLKPHQKRWLKEQTGLPLEELVKQYLSESSQPGQASAAGAVNQALQSASQIEQTIPQQPPQEERPAEEPIKSDIPEQEKANSRSVLLPSGQVGKILSEKDGIAKVEVDGQIKHRKLDDLPTLPMEQKELADLYEEMISKIPESERSSVINWAGYDPNVNELAFRPHSGALYVYRDIPEEFVERLKNAMFSAKTTGQNMYGAWSKGEQSRFAGLSVVIRDLQKLYGGRGKEYVRKYETVHDFLALPEAALKEKNKRKKLGKKT